MPKTIRTPNSLSLKPGSGATEGVLDLGVLGCPACYPWARLMGCEDMKAKDYTCVRIGLSLAWKASLATDYEDSFLCNRLYVTLDFLPRFLYKPEGLVRKGYTHYHSHTG